MVGNSDIGQLEFVLWGPVHGELLIASGIMYLDTLDIMREICEILVNCILVGHSAGRLYANCL
jgi:hypothetical protein